MVRSTQSRGANEPGAYVSVESLLSLRHLAKEISLETRKKSVAMMEGDSRTSFRGRGMEFSEVRPYQAGDDIRNIDWRVTARTQKPYTKLFQEERERPVYLMVDQRSTMFFGSTAVFKSVYAAQVAAAIGWAALHNNDRIGALVFADREQTDSRARRGKHSVLRLIHELHSYNQRLKSPFLPADATSLTEMIGDIRRVAKPGSSIFVLSDFHDFDDACAEPLALLSRHCDITLIQVFDKLERSLPPLTDLAITNDHERIVMSGGASAIAANYEKQFAQRQQRVRETCLQARVKFAAAEISLPVEQLIVDLFNPKKSANSRNIRFTAMS